MTKHQNNTDQRFINTMITKTQLNFIIEDPSLHKFRADNFYDEVMENCDDSLKALIEWEEDITDYTQIKEDYSPVNDLDRMLYEYKTLQYAYIKEGHILWNIYQEFLWKERKEYHNFEDFCKDCLGKPFWQVKQIINASAMATKLIETGFMELPRTINICNVLQLLKNEDDNPDCFEFRLRRIWEQVLELHSTKRTESKVREIIKLNYPGVFPKPRKYQVTLDTEVVDKLEEKAAEEKVTISGFIHHMFAEIEDLNDTIVFLASTIEDLEYRIKELEYELKYSKSPPPKSRRSRTLDINEVLFENELFYKFKEECGKLSINYLSILRKIIIPEIIQRLDTEISNINFSDIDFPNVSFPNINVPNMDFFDINLSNMNFSFDSS